MEVFVYHESSANSSDLFPDCFKIMLFSYRAYFPRKTRKDFPALSEEKPVTGITTLLFRKSGKVSFRCNVP